MLRIALYQPEIPQNAGAILRLGACLGVAVDIIGPAGFTLSDKALRRAGMDYLEHACLTRHPSWQDFLLGPAAAGRLVLLTTKSSRSYTDFAFRPRDVLLFGRESAGVPDQVHEAAAARLTIPMLAGRRSLNVALAAAMVTGEALRQLATVPAQS